MGSKDTISEHQLYITSIWVWLKLLIQNGIDKAYLNRYIKISIFVTITYPLRLLQSLYLLPKKIKHKELSHDPIFIIGHWRSGTTHLHYLMNEDNQFIGLENYQAFFFKIAFLSKWILRPLLNNLMPEKRPQDNIPIDAYAPCEEEHPLTNNTTMCGMQTFFFPRNKSYFNHFNLFKNVDQKKIKKWQGKYHDMLLQIEWFNKEKKQLLLKNPHNTARIDQLIKRYPKAKFIFIHRHPSEVYLSMKHLYKKTISTQFLQEINSDEIEKSILYFYSETLKSYLVKKELIPSEQLIEISFTELEESPVKTIEKIYDKLNLSNFENIVKDLELYCQKNSQYQKNKFESLDDKTIKKIKKNWDFAFKEWNYT